MSNNDLWCSICRSHHHPVECPMDDVEAREIPELKKLMKEPSIFEKDIVKLTAPLLNRLLFFGLGVVYGIINGVLIGILLVGSQK